MDIRVKNSLISIFLIYNTIIYTYFTDEEAWSTADVTNLVSMKYIIISTDNVLYASFTHKCDEKI